MTADSSRGEASRLYHRALRAQQELLASQAQKEQLIAELREANENLVLATVRAQRLAGEADDTRAVMAASEERFRSLVSASAALVFRADADGRVRVEPERWQELTGLSVGADDQESGRAWLQAIPPEDRDLVSDAWARAVATRSGLTRQHRLRRREGRHAWVVTRAVPIPGRAEEGPVREWIGMMTDVTDRVRIDEAREQFIAILGHDLRGPLSTIALAAAHLGEVDGASQGADLSARIARSARRMESMIRDLLDFASGRLGGGIPLTLARCDLGRIVAEQCLEAMQANPGRRILRDASGDLNGHWDPARMEQVLSNLIGNAIQHGVDPIRVSLCADGAEVAMTVENQGQPIPAALIPTIFEPFHPSDQPRKGLGLGLFIASEIVRAHGGTIAVRSTVGEGTAFTIRLPRARPSRLAADEDAHARALPGGVGGSPGTGGARPSPGE